MQGVKVKSGQKKSYWSKVPIVDKSRVLVVVLVVVE